jgi:hypothetical protein
MRLVARLIVAAASIGLISGASVSSITASADPGTVLKFDTMSPVTGPYVGSSNPVGGVAGGGLAWVIGSGMGVLKRDGHLIVHVRGLVLAKTGKNPIAKFVSIVSCQTIKNGAANITTVVTAGFPASVNGDSNIDARVDLPAPCIAPIVFVGVAGPRWFAATGS